MAVWIFSQTPRLVLRGSCLEAASPRPPAKTNIEDRPLASYPHIYVRSKALLQLSVGRNLLLIFTGGLATVTMLRVHPELGRPTRFAFQFCPTPDVATVWLETQMFILVSRGSCPRIPNRE